MCKDWKQGGCNHHFPELKRKRNILRNILSLFTPARMSVVVVAFTLVVGISYLMQINVTATKGYQIKELEKQISQLTENNKKLNLKHIELQSMANVIEQVPSLNLVVTENIETITPIGGVVAMR
jgi:hypothetical protein